MTRFVPIEEQRSQANDVPGGIEISIPAQRQYVFAAFLAFWLCGWAIGMVAVIGMLMHPAKDMPVLFVGAWLGGWTVGGCVAILALLWMLAGREKIVIASDTFMIRREAVGLGWTRRYELRAVRNLRIVETRAPGLFERRDPIGIRSGPFVFDYGARTVAFGAGIDVAEARMLLSRILAAKPVLSILTD